jgi:hypothetical protein
MQLVELHVGGADQAFPADQTVVADFHFPSPAHAASALLQGFQLARLEGDVSVRDVGVELVMHFAAGQSAGSVEVRLRLRGSGGLLLSSDLIQAEIHLLVVGT